jgi:hypothetical protein
MNPPGQQGAAWGGEADVLSRMIQPMAELQGPERPPRTLPHYQIPWRFFTWSSSQMAHSG